MKTKQLLILFATLARTLANAETLPLPCDVRVGIDLTDGTSYDGSGTVVANSPQTADYTAGSYVLTARHVFERSIDDATLLDGRPYIRLANSEEKIPARLVDSDADADLAMLWAETKIAPCRLHPDPETPFVVRSFEGARHYRHQRGRVLRVWIDGGDPVNGQSGGGVYDNDGRLLGVLVGGRPNTPEMRVITGRPLVRLFKRVGIRLGR